MRNRKIDRFVKIPILKRCRCDRFAHCTGNTVNWVTPLQCWVFFLPLRTLVITKSNGCYSSFDLWSINVHHSKLVLVLIVHGTVLKSNRITVMIFYNIFLHLQRFERNFFYSTSQILGNRALCVYVFSRYSIRSCFFYPLIFIAFCCFLAVSHRIYK